MDPLPREEFSLVVHCPNVAVAVMQIDTYMNHGCSPSCKGFVGTRPTLHRGTALVIPLARRPWRATAFACSRQKVCQSAAGTIESSHAARARGNRGDRSPFLCLPKPRKGRLRGRSIAPEGAQRQRKIGVRVTVPRARAPWLLASAPTSGLEPKPFGGIRGRRIFFTSSFAPEGHTDL